MKKLGLLVHGITLTGCVLVFSMSAGAALRVYEGFDYAEGAVNGQNGGTGWNTTWQGAAYTVTTPGLSYGALVSTGNCIVRAAWPEISRTNTFVLTDGQTCWVSVLAQMVDNSGSAGAWMTVGELTVGHTWNANWRITDWVVWGDSGIPVTQSNITLLVTKIVKNAGVNNDSAWLWVNPSLANEPLEGGANQSHVGDLKDIDTSLIRIQEDHLMQWDELRVGDTWADVSPLVPEPALLLLLPLLLCGLRLKR